MSLDLPLDALIRGNKSRGGRGGRGGGGKFRGGNDSRQGGGGAFRRVRNQSRSNPYRNNRDQGDSEGVWEHDRFDDEEEEEEIIETAPVRGRGSAGAGLESGSKLQITNLAFSVNDEDIKDLFEPLGDIKKAFVKYDKSGRSEGTATVIFDRRASAIEAIKKYNNVPLDGQAMKITLVGSAGGAAAVGGRLGGRVGGGERGGERAGARGFRSAVNEASRITISVPNNGRRTGRPAAAGGRRLAVRGSRGASGGRGGRGGRGGGRGGGRQVYVRRRN